MLCTVSLILSAHYALQDATSKPTTTQCPARQAIVNASSSLTGFNASALVESSFTTGIKSTMHIMHYYIIIIIGQGVMKTGAPPTSNFNVKQQATTNGSDSPGEHSDYVCRVAGLTCQAKVN